MQPRSIRALALSGPLLVFSAAVLWASDAPFRAHLTQELSSSFIVLVEHGIDCLIAIPVLLVSWRTLKQLTMREWMAIVAIAVGGSAIASVLFTQSFHYVNPSVAIVLQKVQPLIAISFAALFLGERLHKRFWLWAVVALAGAYLITFPSLVPRTYEGEMFNPNVIGALLALGAAALWGASTVLGKYALRGTSFHVLTSLRFVIAFIFLAVFALVQHSMPAPGTMSGTDWLFLVAIAFTSGVFSLFLYYFGLQYTRASIATIAELGFPFAAVFVNAYLIPGAWQPGTYFGLFAGQWIGTLLLFAAMLMLSRVNREEVLQESRA